MKKRTLFVALIGGIFIGASVCKSLTQKIVKEKDNKTDKFKTYYNILNQWLILKQEGKCLEKYLLEHEYYNIAIYGMGELGNRLLEELTSSTNINVKYGIDKNAASTYSKIGIVDLESQFESVDAIIVTTSFAFQDIKNELEKKINCEIISLEEIIFNI